MTTKTHADSEAAATPALNDVELFRLIKRALNCAAGMAVDVAMTDGRRNAKRSQNWVTCLRNEFDVAYRQAGDEAVRAFCKECGDNKAAFGLNELLHDVCVCRVATVQSRTHNKPLMYVTDVLWQVESEFKNSGAEAIKDFNKLILGSAQNKLFVGPLTRQPESDLAVLTEPANRCGGEVYVALVAHPRAWISQTALPRLFRFDRPRSEWRGIEEPQRPT